VLCNFYSYYPLFGFASITLQDKIKLILAHLTIKPSDLTVKPGPLWLQNHYEWLKTTQT
jgi:hypothetical protein